ncbi:MAG: nucleotidyl transferase AbiEii/AbiGii toxin family protein [Candidatus Aminicenantales bacterium]
MFQNLLERIGRAFRQSQIPYMVIGGQAVLVYGEPRLTKDIDITLGLGIEGLAKIINLVKKLNLKPLVSNIETFVKETMVLPVIHEKSGIRVDLIFSHSPYERQAIIRAKTIKLGRTEIQFAALEDVIIHKMIAGRARDIEDIRTILLKNSKYDSQYISKWLAEFDSALGKELGKSFRAIKNGLSKKAGIMFRF